MEFILQRSDRDTASFGLTSAIYRDEEKAQNNRGAGLRVQQKRQNNIRRSRRD